jgi:hypothetical protein
MMNIFFGHFAQFAGGRGCKHINRLLAAQHLDRIDLAASMITAIGYPFDRL